MNVKKLVAVIPVTDELLDDTPRGFAVALMLMYSDPVRFRGEQLAGRDLALRLTPRYMPLLALIYVALRTPFARGFGHAVVGLGGALAFSLSLLAAYFVLVMTLPR